jgi:hypothetical protein
MINATQMCKAGGKKFSNWYKSNSTKELIETLEKQVNNFDLLNGRTKLLDIKKGGDSQLQGSWLHPDLAVQLAQWISPEFALQVSKWTRELILTGNVNLENERTELNYKKIIKNLKANTDKCYKRKHIISPAFYIISDIDSKSVKFKPGFRLQQHRSSLPGCKLEFLIYSDSANLVETLILTCFEEKRYIHNKEWLFDIDIQTIIRQARTIMNVSNIKYTEEQDLTIYNEEILEDME